LISNEYPVTFRTDEDEFRGAASKFADLGTISIRIQRIKALRAEPVGIIQIPQELKSNQPIHERSKKAGAHRAL